MKHKICLVIQRYGANVNGGAEVHCKLIAEHLTPYYDVEVLTTCAKDYQKWAPFFSPGEYFENGVKIIRFNNEQRATKSQLRYIRHKITHRLWYQYILRFLGIYTSVQKKYPKIGVTNEDNENWLKYQGPYCPDMIQFLEEKASDYSAIIFFSALYYPAAVGVRKFGEKSILIPMLHDEKPNYYPVYQSVMQSPSWILYNTSYEKKIASSIYNITKSSEAIAGVGISLPKIQSDDNILAKYKITNPYIIYVGRIDKGKGCAELIKYFSYFKKTYKKPLTLVMVGLGAIDHYKHRDVLFTGFVPEKEKLMLLFHASFLVVPSRYESLSMVVLESFYYKKPVLANAHSAVLKNHIKDSKGGFYYHNKKSFSEKLHRLLSDKKLLDQFGENAFAYVNKNYSWQIIIEKYRMAIEDIVQNNSLVI